MVRRNYIISMIRNILTEYKLSRPPVNLDAITGPLNISVKEKEIDDEISGFLFRDRSSGRAIIGVNKGHGDERKTFTIAHEIGHFLLHDSDSMHIDRKLGVSFRNAKSSQGTNVCEREANLFAAELLMPRAFLENDLSNIDEDGLDEEKIGQLAEEYGVSKTALTYRLANLGYIDL